MDELIAELERASEGSREFDYVIAYGPPGPDLSDREGAPHYTTSLDDTREQLVPKGVTWSIGSSGVCHVGTEHGKGKTPELGFVIAALKVRRATLSPGQ